MVYVRIVQLLVEGVTFSRPLYPVTALPKTNRTRNTSI